MSLTSVEPHEISVKRRSNLRWVLLLVLISVVLFTILNNVKLLLFQLLSARLPDFATVFLGIFIEAAPFLLFGTLASGIVEVFIAKDTFTRLVPKQRVFGALVGGVMGMCFPVCECGVVPLTRRMLRKGMPLQAGIAFMLATPVLNPIVIASTATAFGFGKVLALRMGLSLLFAIGVGLVFSAEGSPWIILRPAPWIMGEEALDQHHELEKRPLFDRWRQVFLISLDEFFEMGRYLVLGAVLAAGMQTFIPQSMLLAVGKGPLVSVIVMDATAVLLSICSTVDAFVALSFVGTFSPGSILAFLVFGPMVDIKSVLMYWRVFRPRPLLYLVLLPLMMSLLAGLLINYFLPNIL
jgi:uncharacterized membrane protein YraQ (UPF0718 family)